MGYLDSSDAELIALTRLRREQRAKRGNDPRFLIQREALEAFRYGTRNTIRYSTDRSAEFAPKIAPASLGNSRRRSSYRGWRTGQFHAGNRWCHYCEVKMTLPLRKREGYVCSPITATVDHRTPLSRFGADDPSNWVMCCSACNNKKADMTEEEFRAFMETSIAA